jgi:hypothetical protein
LALVEEYLDKNHCTYRSVKQVKKAGNTIAIKLVANRTCEEMILASGFWPEGIICREWL